MHRGAGPSLRRSSAPGGQYLTGFKQIPMPKERHQQRGHRDVVVVEIGDAQRPGKQNAGDIEKRVIRHREAAQHERMRPLLLQVLQGQLRFLAWARDAGRGMGDLGLS